MISLPSNEVWSIDIPEIQDFSAKFMYNYHVPNESIDDSGTTNTNLVEKKSSEINESYVQYATSRVPRFVVFRFTPHAFSSIGKELSEPDLKNTINDSFSSISITDNLRKVMTEDKFSSLEYTSVLFSDGDVEEKIKLIASGSAEIPGLIDANLKAKLKQNNVIVTQLTSLPLKSTSIKNIKNSLKTEGKETAIQNDRYVEKLKSFKINVQLSNKIIGDLISDSMKNEGRVDLVSLYKYANQLQNKSRQTIKTNHKPLVDYINIVKADSQSKSYAVLVGYIIDKIEIRNNTIIEHPPIVVESPSVSTALDFKIRYGALYAYSIRTVVLLTSPAVDVDSDDVANVQLLVSSKPSSKVYVDTIEKIPPKPPVDLDFKWDYENDKLLIMWAFPSNPQRDIKRFQVFRRANVDEAYSLLQELNFDDSDVKFDSNEIVPDTKVKFLVSAQTTFIDDEFDKRSKYIYSIVSIDAHGMTSNYSAQFEITFDQIKNRLNKRLISHSGAPKSYPNFYLNQQTFIDSMKSKGKRLKLFFHPEAYQTIDDDGNMMNVVSTMQDGCDYRLTMLNLDNNLGANVLININDVRTKNSA